jgi:hypothetical protein
MLVPVPGREANLVHLPQSQCPTAFLKGGITFDSKEHVRSGARSLRPDYSDSAHVLFTPVSGVGGGCLWVSLPRVSEQEETSASLCPPGSGGGEMPRSPIGLLPPGWSSPRNPKFLCLFHLQVLEGTISSGPFT